MEQFSHPNQNEELLNQSVSDAELREILERIGHDEFNGTPQPTIRDIAEGTSADPATIGRILGDIRKEDWEKRFGLQLKDHEDRIEDLEANQKRPPVVPPVPTVIHHYETPPYPKYGYGSNIDRSSGSTKQIIGLLVFLTVFLFVIVPSCNTMNAVRNRIDNPFPMSSPWSQPRARVIWPKDSKPSPEERELLERAVQY